MISVLICSANEQLLSQVKKNILGTVGCLAEVIFYDNKKDKKGICEVYNILAAKAVYPFLCFVHEDVLFITKDWGKKVLEIFSARTDVGAIGIAGSKYKSASYSGWFTGITEFDCANYIHQYGHGSEKVCLRPNDAGSLEEVVCLDGVFICCRKEIWQQIKFDEKNITGFHFYDISFTLEAARICSVAVTYEIDLVHITKRGGEFGDMWLETAIYYHSHQQAKLPFTKLPSVVSNAEKIIKITWLDVLKNYNISMGNKFTWIMKQSLLSHPDLYYPVLKFLLYYALRMKYIHNLFKRKRREGGT